MIDIIEWSKNLILNYEIIDEQHKELVSNINKLFDMLSGNASDIVILKIVKDLIDYSIYHLKTEEELMNEYDYPGKKGHILSHNILRNKIKEVTSHIKDGNMEILSVNLLKFLLDWLKEHIQQEDRKLTEYLNNFQKL